MDTQLPQAAKTVSDRDARVAELDARAREARVWTERMVAALGTRECWYSLMDKVWTVETLYRSWRKVRARAGAPGVDGQSVEKFEARLLEELEGLSTRLKSRSYRPDAVKRVLIPKADGGERPLGIPTVRDRVVQGAIVEVIGPIFENRFEEGSYGFRPKRGCKDALRAVHAGLKEGLQVVVDADIRGYFDNIDHGLLLKQLRVRIEDRTLNELIARYLKQEVLSTLGRFEPEVGTPQGAVLSPLLANVYLHGLDVHMRERGYRMVRYADDFVVQCANAEQAKEALGLIEAWMKTAKLSLHPQKTRLVDMRQEGEYFDFLGYRFAYMKGRMRRFIRPKKAKALRQKLTALTPRKCGVSLTTLIDKLNPVLRGIFEYFKHAAISSLQGLEGHLRRRLRRILAKRQHRALGSGRSLTAHQLWPNAWFEAQGLYSLTAAHRAHCHPRC
jgi:RNA-directed DNA polymerase